MRLEFSADDHRYMAEALRLAERGVETSDPNPCVGCVIVAGGRVVGRGWHRAAGEGHAEILALAEAGASARGATAYVTLEPCSHHGRTPPCAGALIEAGIGEVVSAMSDPNPRVAGRGHRQLGRAGIVVRTGLMEEAARAVNPGFVARHERGRPFVRVKLAVSLDGCIAGPDGRSRWITSAPAREDVQHWRARCSCILSSAETVLADDPRLTLRRSGVERTPLRVIVDARGRTPHQARLLGLPGPVVIASCAPAPWQKASAQWWSCRDDGRGRVDLRALLERLASEREVNTVHVEAGAGLSGALVGDGLADELLVYQAPVLVGAGQRMLALPGMENFDDRLHIDETERRRIGPDWRIRYRLSPT